MVKAMTLREVEAALRSYGCRVVAIRGPHVKWGCPCGSHTAPVPRHTIVSPGVVRSDYVALSEDVEPHSFDVIVTVDLDGDLAGEAEAIRAAIPRAEDAQRDAAARSRQLALRLKASGLTGADIAVILRVSPQRVSQLLSSARARLVS